MDTNALIDSGSQVTTISEEFYNTLSPKPHLFSIEELGVDLNIQAAGGNRVPYLGCIVSQVRVPFIQDCSTEVGTFVVPCQHVPVILGTNIISRVRKLCKSETPIPDTWNSAFVSCQSEPLGIVKSTNKVTISLKPNQSVVLSGIVKSCRQVVSAITESTEGASSRIGVCPRAVKLNKSGRNQRVPVKIYNVSAKPVEISPKTPLCELHEVDILRNMDLGENVNSCRQQVAESTSEEEHQLPEGVDVTECAVTEDQRKQLKEFLCKWKGIFSKGITDLGNCDLVKHKIHLHDEQPFKEPHRRIPPALFQEVREHLREMLEAGAIRPSKSPYSSNVVIVRKKDGSIRFCVDFRKLNSRTIKDAYAIPRTEDTLHLLAGAKYFSKLDLRSGYWQVEIEEDDKPKTAFQVGTLGFYEFHRMPFGLCNAPATFQRLMEMCMGEMNLKECLVYLDDVIIFSTTFEEHIERLQAVFSRLQEHNLKLKATKCEFMKFEVTYLGHIVSEEGIKTDPEKTSAIKNWPVPKTVKDVRAFLGFTGYYRRFIQNYAKIARPLNDLLVGHSTVKKDKAKRMKAKKAPFDWTDDQQEAFEALKEKLTKPPVLAYADYRFPFRLHTDASSTGIGAVLYQQQNGRDRVVCYASRSLKPSEKNYPAHKLEFLALKWSVTEKFHDYLYGTNFEVYTDNNPLTYVFSTAKLDATGHRWIAELSNYDFTITYRSGKKNADADGLSRLHESELETTVFPEVLKSMSQLLPESESTPLVSSLATEDKVTELDIDQGDTIPDEFLASTALTAQNWQRAQSADSNIRVVVDAVLEGTKPTTDQAKSKGLDVGYLHDWDKYFFKEGILYKSEEINGQTFHRLVLPEALRDLVFRSYHDDLGHQGRDRTASLIRQRYFWPYMNQYIRKRVQQCERCICRKTTPVKSAHLVSITSSAPMELVCIDYLSLERSKGGSENILVITDHFSRYAQAIPTRNQSARTTARALFENFFVHYGFPAKLHSDKGANFESKVIRKLCKIAGIQKTRTTPYHPMGNGMVERFNHTLLNMLGTMSEKRKSDWKASVPTLTHAYNAAVHESTSFSPFFLMFGRHPRLAIDALLGIRSSEERKSHQDYADKLKNRLADAYQNASEEARLKGKKYKRYYDQGVRNSVLEPGDRVLVKKVGFKGKHKLADIWDSTPYIVQSQPMPDIPVYMVQKEHSTNKPKPLHRNMLLPFNALPCQIAEPKPRRQKPQAPATDVVPETYEDTTTDSSSSDDEEEAAAVEQPSVPRYIIPARRPQRTTPSSQPSRPVLASPRPSASQQSSSRQRSQPRVRRGGRIRRQPAWMRDNPWQMGMRPDLVTAGPENVFYRY